MDKLPKIEYPCTKCDRIEPCQYRDCRRYMVWFHQEWESIQEAAKEIKEKKIRRIKW